VSIMFNEHREVGEWDPTWETEELRENQPLFHFHYNSHMTLDRTRSRRVRKPAINAWAMAREE
jgi:hypothetical protein